MRGAQPQAAIGQSSLPDVHPESTGDAKGCPNFNFPHHIQPLHAPLLSPCIASVQVLKYAAACNLLGGGGGSFPSPLKSLFYALHQPGIVQVNVLLFWRKDLWCEGKGSFPPKTWEDLLVSETVRRNME